MESDTKFSRRLLYLSGVVGVTFIIGSAMYFIHSGTGQGSNEYFPVSILFFPMGLLAWIGLFLRGGGGHTARSCL